MSEVQQPAEADEDRLHSQEPAEGAENPGEVEPVVPHAETPAEGGPE